MRVVMVSKALVVEAYRRKLAALAEHADLDLTAIVPPLWPEGGRPVRYAPGRDERGYRVIVEPIRWPGHFHLHYYPGLAARLRALRPDILHIDEESYNLATFLALLAGKRAGARVLFFTWQNIAKRYPFPFGAFERFTLRHANYALAGNRDAAAILRRKGYHGPLAVIPQFGADPDLFVPADPVTGRRPAANHPTDRPFTVGMAGRLVPEKGGEMLLRAAATLDGEWRLRYLGAGPEAARLARLATDLGVAGRVRFEPPVPSTAMAAWYAGLDALVVPSLTTPGWKEQFGRVLVEAMLVGVPVVGSNSGEIPHVIGGAGLVFPEGDAAALHAHLAALRASPTIRARVGAAGRQRALAHFTQRRIADATYAVYREMVDHPWPDPRPRLAPLRTTATSPREPVVGFAADRTRDRSEAFGRGATS